MRTRPAANTSNSAPGAGWFLSDLSFWRPG